MVGKIIIIKPYLLSRRPNFFPYDFEKKIWITRFEKLRCRKIEKSKNRDEKAKNLKIEMLKNPQTEISKSITEYESITKKSKKN